MDGESELPLVGWCYNHFLRVRSNTISQTAAKKLKTIVVGQGLAGTAVAWELHNRGHDFVVIDPGDSAAASHIAAGLVTPVAGKRFAVAPHFAKLYQHATTFYALVENTVKTRFFLSQPALRLCYHEEELELFAKRSDALLAAGQILLCPDSELTKYHRCALGFVMPRAARLLTSTYLAQSRRFFQSSNRLVEASVDVGQIEVSDNYIRLASLDVTAHQIIFCRGYLDELNPWLPENVFNSAKGEVLTVKIPGHNETRTVHAYKSWLNPTTKQSVFSFGATYDHDAFENGITPRAREELTDRLARVIPSSFEVLDQQSGVRPIGMQRKAIVGRHKRFANVAWLNGLGSKGSLLAPYLAYELIDALDSQQDVVSPLTPAHVNL